MLPIHFGYLILVIVGMIFWTIFYILRKDLRKFMIYTATLYGILSLVTGYIWWTVDWWHPETITGTRIGVEDFFTGFGAGGVMMVIYQVFFKKKIISSQKSIYSLFRILFSVVVLTVIHVLIKYIGFTSFQSFTLVTTLATVFMWIIRKDLIIPSLWSGILTTICILPLYWTTIITTPGWVSATYDFRYLSGILTMGIPVEELIFWFIAGSFIGILSAYTWSGKFVDYKR